MTRHHRTPRLLAAGAAAAVAFSLAACQPEPVPSGSAEPDGTMAEPTETVESTPTPTPTETDAFVLPSSCEEIYSADMRATLEADNPPLNDPGVTMYSSENAVVLELIDSGAPTLRCTWGTPSDYGLATNITLIDDAQGEEIAAELSAAGFSSEDVAVGSIHRIEQRGITLDDEPYTLGETHVIGDGAIITTRWINFAPEGYSEDIIATLWGADSADSAG